MGKMERIGAIVMFESNKEGNTIYGMTGKANQNTFFPRKIDGIELAENKSDETEKADVFKALARISKTIDEIMDMIFILT